MNAREIGSLPLGAVIEQADLARNAGRLADAASVYRTWLDASVGSPGRAVALFNYGVLAAETGQIDQAIVAYQEADSLPENLPQVNINLGLAYERKQQFDSAVSQWHEAIRKADKTDAAGDHSGAKTLKTTALNHIGRLLESKKIYDQAEAALTQSLEIEPNQEDAAQHWVHLRQRQSKWETDWRAEPITENFALQSMSPLASLAHTDDPVFHLAAAQSFVSRKFPYRSGNLWSGPLQTRKKIRIGYVSGDLCTHAVGLLMAPWIEAHDKEKFEIFAFDFSPEDGTSVRARLKNAFDYFVSIKSLSDDEAATLIRRCDIDVLVDMHGLSSGARPKIFSTRPAALNATFLGFLGTTAMSWNDWIIADAFAIPPHQDRYYSEKVLRLPRSVLPIVEDLHNHSAAPIGTPTKKTLRKTIGCLNNGYKYTPEIVGAWGRALAKNEEWKVTLLKDNQTAAENIEKKLIQCGADGGQINWIERQNIEKYRETIQDLDLYVDTFPYNAGSTARDVICARVPLLTIAGRNYMSRVASSALLHLGLTAGVTNSITEYEVTLNHLMSDPAALASYKDQINSVKLDAGPVEQNVRFWERTIGEYLSQ